MKPQQPKKIWLDGQIVDKHEASVPTVPNLSTLDMLSLQTEVSRKELNLVTYESLVDSRAALEAVNYSVGDIDSSIESLTSCTGREYQEGWANSTRADIEKAYLNHGVRTYYVTNA